MNFSHWTIIWSGRRISGLGAQLCSFAISKKIITFSLSRKPVQNVKTHANTYKTRIFHVHNRDVRVNTVPVLQPGGDCATCTCDHSFLCPGGETGWTGLDRTGLDQGPAPPSLPTSYTLFALLLSATQLSATCFFFFDGNYLPARTQDSALVFHPSV